MKSTTILLFLLIMCSARLNASQEQSTKTADKIIAEKQQHADFQKHIKKLFESEEYKRKVYFDLNQLVAHYSYSGQNIQLAQAQAARIAFENQNRELIGRLIEEQYERDFVTDFVNELQTH